MTNTHRSERTYADRRTARTAVAGDGEERDGADGEEVIDRRQDLAGT